MAILTEPLACITKSLRQAEQVQARLDLWEPRRALVIGAGTIGLLATLALRLRGLEVTTFGRRPGPYRNSELLDRLGARYVSASDADLAAVTRAHGPSTSSSRAPAHRRCWSRRSRPWLPTGSWRSSASRPAATR